MRTSFAMRSEVDRAASGALRPGARSRPSPALRTTDPTAPKRRQTATETTDVARAVHGIDLFDALHSRQLDSVVAAAHLMRLQEGERLFDHGQPARRFFHLLAGQIKLFRNSPSGGEKIMEIVQPGETFAQAVMFTDPGDGYPVSAEAIDPSVLLGFDNEVLRAVLRESVDTCFRMLASLSHRLRQQVDEIEKLTLHSAVSRLAGYLVEQLPRGVQVSSGIHLRAPKNIIASRLGIQPETFSRTAARLMKDGLIRVQGQDVVVLDVEGLRARADA